MSSQQILNVITEDTRFELFLYDHKEDGNEIIVWKTGSSNYLATDHYGLEVIGMLSLQMSIREIKKILLSKYHIVDKRISMSELLQVLLDSGIIRKINDIELEPMQRNSWSITLTGVDKYAILLTSHKAMIFYAIVVLIGLYNTISLPATILNVPFMEYEDHSMWTFVFTLCISIILMIVHESGHYIAARSFGIDAVINFRWRFIFLTAVTSVNDLWSKSKKQRYYVYYAGIIVDFLVLALTASMLNMFFKNASVMKSLTVYYLTIALYMTAMKIILQWCIVLKSDMYWIISTWFDCKNLFSDSTEYLSEILKATIKRKSINSKILSNKYTVKQRTGIIGFAIILLATGSMTIGFIIIIVIPYLYSILTHVQLSSIISKWEQNSLNIMMGLFVFTLSIMTVYKWRSIVLRKRISTVHIDKRL